MADNLPLIPSKSGLCKDVRPVLRTVFRDQDFLPPIPNYVDLEPGNASQRNTHSVGQHKDYKSAPTYRWFEQYKLECKQISDCEDEIKDQFAKRIAREPVPNIFKLHRQRDIREVPKWRLDRGLIDRKDLIPTVEQNSNKADTLWIKNILNISSCNVSAMELDVSCFPSAVLLSTPDHISSQICSVDRVLSPPLPPPLVSPSIAAQRDYIVCVPARLNFVNFSIGQIHMKCIRLINISKFECRLSITPTKRRELDIEISSSRGLTVTSGAAIELKVRFKPTDVRELNDIITVRVSCGQVITVPIACYMQPPLLTISLPNRNSSMQIFISAQKGNYKSSHSLIVEGDTVELGTRLLGDVHCAPVLFHCHSKHASFFLITEQAWSNWNLDCLSSSGSLIADSFVVWPSWWRGGGVVRSCWWCRATNSGLHVAHLRVLSSTAITKPLHIFADVVYFKQDHIVIQAHEKDYDICSDDDAECDYYVHLGTCFPHRSLTATVQLVNKSPIFYKYYWIVRPWGVCHCWEEDKQSQGSLEQEDERLCYGAVEARIMSHQDPVAYAKRNENIGLVKMDPVRGQISARSTCDIHVNVPDVGANLGVQRAVVMLVLENIPKESFPVDYDPMIVRTRKVKSTSFSDVKSQTREVCDVVTAQMEIWWEVVPLRFVIDPPRLPLYHSRRLKSTSVCLSSWQLFGLEESHVSWKTPGVVPPPPPLCLTTAECTTTNIELPLPALPDQYPESDVLTLVATNDEWKSQCHVMRQCATRHPALRPVITYLGIVPPGTEMKTTFRLSNNTYQDIYYWCEAFRWCGENEPRPVCVTRNPCENCKEVECTCAILKPTKGALKEGDMADINYHVNAPLHDSCVATLITSRRCEPDLAQIHSSPASEARASLVAYRVLAPQVTLRILPCFGADLECTDGCGLDGGDLRSKLGTAILRPSAALVVGRRTCYRILLTNITPLPTAVHFDFIDDTDFLNVKFIPNDFNIKSYGQVEIRVVLNAREVCERRIFVYRALLLQAHKPLYLVIDTAITGVQISCELPIGSDINSDDFLIIRRTQIQENSQEQTKCTLTTQFDIFAEEDRKRAIVKENICHCRFKMIYIPPGKKAEPPTMEEEYCPPVEIIEEPLPLTRVCPCDDCSKPSMRDAPESISMQFRNIPLRKVCERRVTLRNESVVTARWSTVVRRWPRKHVRTMDTDEWRGDVGDPGVVVSCSPWSGVLGARAHTYIYVRVYADCWGLYREQILVQIEKVDPIAFDVWIEATGSPLQLKMLQDNTFEIPTMWMSNTDPERSLHIKNISRTDLIVHAYVSHRNERIQDVLPFRLYLRLYDLPPVPCPCYTKCNDLNESLQSSNQTVTDASYELEMDTGVDLYLAPDYGVQNDMFFKVSPLTCTIKVGECVNWNLKMNAPPPPEMVPDAMLLLRLLPVDRAGLCWYRRDPPPQLVRLRQAIRESELKLSCDDIAVKICALDVPYEDSLRVRQYFRIQNVGNGTLDVSIKTSHPWSIIQECTAVLGCEHISHTLPPRSLLEICLEVCVYAKEIWPSVVSGPCARPNYPLHKCDTTSLQLYNAYQVLKVLPLMLDIEYPLIQTEPSVFDFGFVSDGDTRKTYITVSHTSRTNTLQVKTRWVGPEEFRIWPPFLELPPGGSARVYIQYTAVWRHGVAEGCCHVSVCTEAGGVSDRLDDTNVATSTGAGWCRTAVPVRASPTRDHKCHTDIHDHTDDEHLMPLLEMPSLSGVTKQC